MTQYVSTLSESQHTTRPRENTYKLGKVLVESLKARGVDVRENLAKKFNVAKEDLSIDEGDVYSTAISGFIEQRLQPKLAAVGAIKSMTAPGKGYDSIKIPLRNALVTASDLPDNGELTSDTGSYQSTTVTLRYSYAKQQIEHELLQFANVDMLAEELGQLGTAIERKIDSDVIAAFKASTTTALGNHTKLGTTTTVTFATLAAGRRDALKNYAEPDMLIISPETEYTIIALGNLAGTTNVIGSMVMKGNETTHYPIPQAILGMKVVVSQQVDDDDIYLVDSKFAGYLIRKGGVETFDGRVSNYLAFEVIAAHAYGVGIVQPKAIYRVEENAY